MIGFKQKILAIGLALGVGLAAPQAAQATAINISGVSLDPTYGGQNGTLTYTPTGYSAYDGVGEILLTGSANGSSIYWKSFCVDLFTALNPAQFTVAEFSTLNVGQTKLDQLNALLSHVDANLTSNDTSVAAQLAIWEILYDNSGSYDVRNGLFSVGGVSDNAVAYANQALSLITSGYWTKSNMSIALLTSDNNQSQIVWGDTAQQAKALASVPEPATWAMMLIGFGALGIAIRRRRGTALHLS